MALALAQGYAMARHRLALVFIAFHDFYFSNFQSSLMPIVPKSIYCQI